MAKQVVRSERAPSPIGPYAQAIRAGELVFCSGQIAIDPQTGELVKGGVEAETRQVMKNLTAVLEAAGASWKEVVRTTIYLVDMADFGAVSRVYAEHVGAEPPARATVQVAALPKGAMVEIDAVAHLDARGGARND